MSTHKGTKVFGCILLLLGLVISAIGLARVNEAKGMLSAIEAGSRLVGAGDNYASGIQSWTEHAETGRIIGFSGIAVSGIGLIILLVGVTQSNADKRMKRAAEDLSKEIIQQRNTHTDSTNEVLKKLNELRVANLITEEEYSQKRKEILDELTKL